MTVALSSLRVVAGMESSAYVSGMAQKIAADREGAASSAAVGAAHAQTDRKLSDSANRMTALAGRYVEGARSAQTLARDVNSLARQIDLGNATMGTAQAVIDGMVRRHGQLGGAAELAARGHVELAKAIGDTNARFAAEADSADRAAAAVRRLADAQRASSMLTGLGSASASSSDLIRANERANALLSGMGTPIAAVSSQAKLATHEVQNLSFQLNDIVMGLATGQSPFTVMMQQGTQVSQVLGNRGVGAAVSGVGAALASLVNPVTLTLAGITAVGIAGAAAFNALSSSGQRFKETLSEQERLLRLVQAAYRNASRPGGNWSGGDASQAVSLLQAQINAARLRTEVAAAQRELLHAFDNTAISNPMGDFTGVQLDAMDARFAAFADPINRLLDQIRSGRPDFDAFARQLNDIAQAQPSAGMSKTADEVLKLGERAMTAQTALSKMDAVTRVLAGTASAADYTLAGLGESLAKIREGATGGYLTLQNFLPGMTDFVGRQRDIQSATKTYQEAITSLQQLYRMGEIGGREYSQQTTAYRSMYGQALDAINNRPSDAQKQAANEAEQRAEIYTRSVAAIREQTRALDAERATMSMSQEAAQRYRTEQDLLSDAQRAGRPITASLTEEIGKLATAYAAAEMAMRAARLEQDLLFERAQLFRSPTEQRVASELRGVGIDAGSEQGRMLAATIRYNEALRESRDLALEFGSSIRNDLQNGVSAIDALSNAFTRLADRLLDMAMNQAINGLFSNLMGAFGGSAFGGGNVAGYFGSSGYTNNLAYGGARAAGGIIRGPGTGTSDSIVARVSNGEFIVNAAATAMHRSTLEQINRRTPAFASGGMVGGSSSIGAAAPIIINARVRPQAGETAEVSAKRSPNGDIDLEVVIRRIEGRVADGIVRNRGPISRALSARGASPSTRG